MCPLRLHRRMWLSGVLALSLGLVALGDPPTTEYRERPWHLATVTSWFRFPDDPKPLESFSVDLQLTDDLPESPQFFVVPLNGGLNETLFYFGVMSQSYEVSDGDGWKTIRSSGFIFTRWGTMDRDYIRPTKGGHFLASDHEGKHVSVRVSSPVASGRYTFTLKVVEKVTEGKNPHVWVGGYVHSHATNKTEYVGALRFDGTELTQRYGMSSFLEVLADDDPKKNVSDTMPNMKLAIGRWEIDGKPVKPIRTQARYEEQVPQKAKAALWGTIPEADRRGIAKEMRDDQTFMISVRDKLFTREGTTRFEDKRKRASGAPIGWVKIETLFEQPR